jgi:hypothetical protein
MRDLYDRKDEAREKFLDMDEYVWRKEKELADMEIRLQQQKQEYEPYKAQEELNAINKYFPLMPEQMRFIGLCEQIELTFDTIRTLLFGKTLTSDSVKLYSPEHQQHFQAKDIQLKIEKEADNPGRLHLSLNGQNIIDWFKEQFNKLHQGIRSPIIQPKQGGGRKRSN